MAIASAPLSPNELTNPSMRVAAVKAEMQAVPKEFTAPCTSSFPIYRLDCCSADTSPNRTVRDSSPPSTTISWRRNTANGIRFQM